MGAPVDLKKRANKKTNGLLKAEDIDDLNSQHAIVMLGGKCVVLNEVIDPIFSRPDISFSSPGDFKTKYMNRKIYEETNTGETKAHNAANLWLQHAKRREYAGIVFSPGKEVPGFYNLYRGLDVVPAKGGWHLFRKHLFENICSEEPEYFEYLLNWMADLVQNPGGLNGVSVVLRGGRGTGKGLFANSFGKIFGSHYLHIQNQNHLVGKFNAHHKDALLIFADECFWAGNKTSEGILKGLITEDTIQVEAKGKDPIRVANHVHLVIASNEDWVVPAGLDERRFFCLDVQEKHKQSIPYWNPIWEETRNGGISAMLFDLMNREYDPVALRTPPKTDALICQIEHSMTPIQKWWYQCLKDGRFSKDGFPWDGPIATETLHNSYLEFCKSINVQWPEARNIFAASIRKLSLAHSCRLPPPSMGKPRPHGLFFQEIGACRLKFESLVHGHLDWEDD